MHLPDCLQAPDDGAPEHNAARGKCDDDEVDNETATTGAGKLSKKFGASMKNALLERCIAGAAAVLAHHHSEANQGGNPGNTGSVQWPGCSWR